MNVLKKEELKKMIDSGENFVLIDVLDKKDFERHHIPGAVNIPVHGDNFMEKVAEKVPGKNTKIVVYCASFECQASPGAAKKLTEAGYTNVFDYEGGIKDWKQANYPVEIITTHSHCSCC